ncbi:hypothetical protein BDP55DRAFT_735598 [Colletotrichum godetiae]|uniref:Uncharacterized protein n=1 Tax=Colletotrichum godetiae TaxID=1209918 RepID=A0AAJ0A8N0_9PEZI|nr:uncharacterized protein BDP55DRAFT_735598 [Colletotrichum godetiae]KAK1656560.1 hypothetical protein BDP55DRAFT_735598 [Colletotrichum godetiae]
MGGWTGFLITYLLGGLTFLPLDAETNRDAVADAANTAAGGPGSIVQPGDDLTALEAVKAAGKDDATAAATKRSAQDNDVAAGYFACAESNSMGINAKPIERSTPTGSTTVATPSQSVYQTMYRSIFERKPTQAPWITGTG